MRIGCSPAPEHRPKYTCRQPRVADSLGVLVGNRRRRDCIGLDLHLKAAFGEKTPPEIGSLDVERVKKKLSKRLKPATIKNTFALLRRICNFGADQGLCRGLSFKIRMPLVDNFKVEDLSPADFQRLMKALDESDDIQVSNMMRMAMVTGISG